MDAEVEVKAEIMKVMQRNEEFREMVNDSVEGLKMITVRDGLANFQGKKLILTIPVEAVLNYYGRETKK